MSTKLENKKAAPYNSYISNPKRNRKEIVEIRAKIHVWLDEEANIERRKKGKRENEGEDNADTSRSPDIGNGETKRTKPPVNPFPGTKRK